MPADHHDEPAGVQLRELDAAGEPAVEGEHLEREQQREARPPQHIPRAGR
jgi:hypothetical protein